MKCINDPQKHFVPRILKISEFINNYSIDNYQKFYSQFHSELIFNCGYVTWVNKLRHFFLIYFVNMVDAFTFVIELK